MQGRSRTTTGTGFGFGDRVMSVRVGDELLTYHAVRPEPGSVVVKSMAAGRGAEVGPQ